jgi:hypothetical protein
MSDIYIHSAIFKWTRAQKRTQRWKQIWKLSWKRIWKWKRKRKLYLIRRNGPYSTVRIVANVLTAQFPIALCSCSTYLLWKHWHKNFYRHWNYSLNYVLAELERSLWSYKKDRYQRYVQEVEINLLHFKSCMRWRWHLKGLSHERGWSKPDANLGASPFKRDLSNHTTFSPTNLDGQSL